MYVRPSSTASFATPFGGAWHRPSTGAAGYAGAAPQRTAAPRPEPRPIAGGLDRLLFDGVSARTRLLAAVEAERGFGEGNRYLSGLLVDRSA